MPTRLCVVNYDTMKNVSEACVVNYKTVVDAIATLCCKLRYDEKIVSEACVVNYSTIADAIATLKRSPMPSRFCVVNYSTMETRIRSVCCKLHYDRR